jgi:hypothetical protein
MNPHLDEMNKNIGTEEQAVCQQLNKKHKDGLVLQ